MSDWIEEQQRSSVRLSKLKELIKKGEEYDLLVKYHPGLSFAANMLKDSKGTAIAVTLLKKKISKVDLLIEVYAQDLESMTMDLIGFRTTDWRGAVRMVHHPDCRCSICKF